MSSLRPKIPRSLWRLLVMSAVLHLVVFAGVAVAGLLRDYSSPAPVKYIPTKLVKLGKKRPKELLPTVDVQPAPPPKPDVTLAKATPETPTTTATPKPAMPDALDRAKEETKVTSALDRLKKIGKSDPVGDPDGVEDGDVSDASKAIAGQKYATEIYRCMKANYAVEGVDRARVRDREATILVRVQPDGKLFGEKITKRSGLPAFDRAVERAIKRCGKVSPPPKEIKDLVANGVEIVFQP